MKRLLALSGGGVRGIVEVAFLEAVERVYRARRGPEARLSDIFDLVGGTSTGALIAAGIALGRPVSEIAGFYLGRAPALFGAGQRWRFGFAPVFDSDRLEAEIRREVGELTLGDPALRTYLAIVMKRLDTGSPWIVSNIPHAPYFEDPADGGFIGNRNYPLARLLRASSAAPTYFRQQTLDIVPGEPPGVFVDGGASPYNDPSLALLMLARMRAFGLCWPAGEDRLFVLSLGTGRFRQRVPPESAARAGPLRLALDTLTALVGDAELQTLTLMEWLGRSCAPEVINGEIGRLGDDNAFGAPQFAYLRLDLPLERDPLASLGIDLADGDLARFRRIDDPGIILPLYELAREVCARRYDLDQLLP
ncbi:MAG: patatin-like phospholipase family protein [Paracoccaceae bacterium]